jgi:hypothetical protein
MLRSAGARVGPAHCRPLLLGALALALAQLLRPPLRCDINGTSALGLAAEADAVRVRGGRTGAKIKASE